MTKYGRIYIIRNTVNNKVYIGQTYVSINLRFQNHLSAARRGLDYVIGKAIRKYGEDKFYVELLEECLVEELNEREIYWISFFKATDNRFGYNMSIGGHVVRTTKELNEIFILNEFDSGKSAMKIAKEQHVHPYKIADILKRNNRLYGIDKQRLSQEKENYIITNYLEGYGTMNICRKLNVGKGTVRKVLLKHNIKLRNKKETKILERNLPTL